MSWVGKGCHHLGNAVHFLIDLGLIHLSAVQILGKTVWVIVSHDSHLYVFHMVPSMVSKKNCLKCKLVAVQPSQTNSPLRSLEKVTELTPVPGTMYWILRWATELSYRRPGTVGDAHCVPEVCGTSQTEKREMQNGGFVRRGEPYEVTAPLLFEIPSFPVCKGGIRFNPTTLIKYKTPRAWSSQACLNPIVLNERKLSIFLTLSLKSISKVKQV